MARNPKELVIETILEGYRHEHRIIAEGSPPDVDADMFTEPSHEPRTEGKVPRARRRCRAPRVPLADAGQRGRATLGGGAFDDRSFADVVTADISPSSTVTPRPNHMITPETGKEAACGTSRPTRVPGQLDWADAFVREEVEPLDRDLAAAEVHPAGRDATQGIDRSRSRSAEGLWATHLGPDSVVKVTASSSWRCSTRSSGVPVGADRLRVPGPRHRQRRDHRALRHAGAEGALPAPAARRRIVLQLFDDRAAGRRGPDTFKTSAVADGDDWVINGWKFFSSNAGPRRSSSSWR